MIGTTKQKLQPVGADVAKRNWDFGDCVLGRILLDVRISGVEMYSRQSEGAS